MAESSLHTINSIAAARDTLINCSDYVLRQFHSMARADLNTINNIATAIGTLINCIEYFTR